MWKNINYRIKKLEQENERLKKVEQENAWLKRVIEENTDWMLVPDDGDENISESEDENRLESPELPVGQDSNNNLIEGSKKKSRRKHKIYLPKSNTTNWNSIVSLNKKMISTTVVNSESGEGTIYHISKTGCFSVLFKNGEERDFPSNAFGLGLLKRK